MKILFTEPDRQLIRRYYGKSMWHVSESKASIVRRYALLKFHKEIGKALKLKQIARWLNQTGIPEGMH